MQQYVIFNVLKEYCIPKQECVVHKDYNYDFKHLTYFPVIPYFTLSSVSSDKSYKFINTIRCLRDKRNQIYLQILTLDLHRTINTCNKTLYTYR